MLIGEYNYLLSTVTYWCVRVAPRGPPFDLEEIKARLIQQHPDMYGAPVAREYYIQHQSLCFVVGCCIIYRVH